MWLLAATVFSKFLFFAIFNPRLSHLFNITNYLKLQWVKQECLSGVWHQMS